MSPLSHLHPLTIVAMQDQILDALNEGVHVINQDGTSIIYNRKMAELESMKKEEVLGKKLWDVFQFPTGQESTMLQVLSSGSSMKQVRQTYFNDKGKEITTINSTLPLLKEGQVLGVMEIASDVTKMERLLRENYRTKEPDVARFTFDSIIGKSTALTELIELATRAARTSSSVLVAGETGTGKEMFVQSIHNASSRSKGPFISQNCAALPDSLIESLLFGTSKGAFTGAIERPGLFEQAEGGTLFLDEMNSLPLSLQAKLLRALQEKTIRRIGDTSDRPINVRIIAAINEDPIEAISSQKLRKDLYYRLSVVTLQIPPLRERKEDIPLLVTRFIEDLNHLFQMNVQGIDDEVAQFFLEYDWPGNVRELEHLIEGAMNLMADEACIGLAHLPFSHRDGRGMIAEKMNRTLHEAKGEASPFTTTVSTNHSREGAEHVQFLSLKDALLQFETSYLASVLQQHNGNISQAAHALQISRQSLQYRLRRLHSSILTKK
ncbi:sigma-54 interaction domain-containing protein [Brevibacillus daliensis]|uniref:sigma-54 interaction domain-containing protein n=1 Tax=Brevibacillus daliensis TaxID=2892995 RepID=UPI001E576223|nr:sigma 54-interacting transcriptional regulator [Brevibacillus daliensis]